MRKRHLLVLLILASLAMFLLGPSRLLLERIEETRAVFSLASIAVSEALFILGLFIMSMVVGVDLGKNPFKWRAHFRTLVSQVRKQKLFWVGFWINAVGAIGSGVLIIISVIVLLEPKYWALCIIGLIDLIITLAIRFEILTIEK